MRILVAEDEPDMQKILKLYLEKDGYQVVQATSGTQALEMACDRPFDLILLDWMLPGIEGVEVCRQLRTYGVTAKILMLTARCETDDELEGLSGGADDYVKKPFEPRILLLRIKKLLQAEALLCCGNVTLNRQTQLVHKGDSELHLTKKEYDLLQALLLGKGRVLSRENLLGQVWGLDYQGDERTVDTHIRRLRGKLGEGYITTQVGLGYSMVNPDE